MTDYGSLYDEPCDELTAAERRAMFYVRRLMIDEGRMIAGVWVYRRANRRYRVGSVPSPQTGPNGTLKAAQLWAVREVLRAGARGMTAFTTGSLFAGIGGIDLAFEAAGFRTAWQVEIADYPRAVLAARFPHAAQHRDIYDCHSLPFVDVLTAGFPCQPFSVAGKKRGMADERYMVLEMMRVIAEVSPYVVFLENVPHFASLADGNAFKQLLRALASLGYDAQWGHLRASDAGAPHRRERWFCVAYADHERRTEQKSTPLADRMGQCPRRVAARRKTWLPQPRLGRNVNGLPYRLDRHQFPAPPGQSPRESEPPHVAPPAAADRARITALGNAVVPQVIYPVAQAIHEWLDAQARERAA